MGIKLINESSLTAIGNAIRAKNGSSDTYSPAEMVTAISNISSGGGAFPSSWFNRGSDLQGLFRGSGFYNTAIMSNPSHLSQITTSDVISINYMCQSETDPSYSINNLDLSSLVINFKSNSDISCNSAFSNNINLTKLPTFILPSTSQYIYCSEMFKNCYSLPSVDDFMNEGIFNTTGNYSFMFQNCHNLRHIPHLEKLKTTQSNNSYMIYYYGFQNCYELQEVLNLPVETTTRTSNIFNSTADSCHTLSRYTFETNNGTPLVANWNAQQIKLDTGKYIGYFSSTFHITDSNIPLVTDATTYDLYKNDVYHTTLLEYSRYNHTSAVETINSLPDTSAYLTANGGTNKIKFLGDSGSLTDGGAISNLTAEEIAVATNKGWTVVIS